MKNLANKLNITTPVIYLIILFIVANFSFAFFAVFGKVMSSAYQLIYFIAFIWVIGWWLKEDNLKYKEKWIYDIGILLYVVWIIVIPIYLFRTRGLKALISFLKFGIIYFGTVTIGLVISLLIKMIYQL